MDAPKVGFTTLVERNQTCTLGDDCGRLEQFLNATDGEFPDSVLNDADEELPEQISERSGIIR